MFESCRAHGATKPVSELCNVRNEIRTSYSPFGRAGKGQPGAARARCERLLALPHASAGGVGAPEARRVPEAGPPGARFMISCASGSLRHWQRHLVTWAGNAMP